MKRTGPLGPHCIGDLRELETLVDVAGSVPNQTRFVHIRSISYILGGPSRWLKRAKPLPHGRGFRFDGDGDVDEARDARRERMSRRRSDSADYSFWFNGAEMGRFVRTTVDTARRAGVFQADDEGSIPFTRSSLRSFGASAGKPASRA